ncbi:MAG: LacI family DNA-binding transcriptional regulator [Devosia nanyangense]|uniref:LacI family DNA-binding transcriptional regulator n=1 Tax=Devosia nanyangense TaxID=1228055 RepID=A0A933L877_9HYPH|nr:LacI family DNA-binding transcriptional regulator [Devosia nanyangense]
MDRPTIADLAQAAGVSISTVNRLLHATGPVRKDTIDRIVEAAERIGFYGLGAIRERSRSALPHYRLGFLLQQSHRQWYRMIEEALGAAARRRRDMIIEPSILFEDDLAPEAVAANLTLLGERCDALALIAADHPIIGQAIEGLRAKGVPTVAYITDQSASSRAGYVGTDNWKLGRTAAWFIQQMTFRPGRVVTFIGNHRYQCQDISDASFRSYMREHAPHILPTDTLLTQENPDNAYNQVRTILTEMPDLVGIFVSGGGISGVLRAMREQPTDKQRGVRIVCRDMGSEARKGLQQGLISAALYHPLERTSDELIEIMVETIGTTDSPSIIQRIIPFEIATPESVDALL